jgi:hypothetical protein
MRTIMEVSCAVLHPGWGCGHIPYAMITCMLLVPSGVPDAIRTVGSREVRKYGSTMHST